MRIGRIRVEALLGSGGMGEVYRGWDEKLERAVALKVVHSDKRLNAAMRARFLREARVLSRLDHPNICRLYDVLEREDGDYLVLELVEGTTLRARMENGLSKSEAVDVALQVARVLAATHARGIVHRDLKPDNVMITAEGVVKVLDFGLARATDEITGVATRESTRAATQIDFDSDDAEKTAVLGSAMTTTDPTHTSAGSLVGTLHYMSPEQARGLPISEASDVYSLGILLYELLAPGRRAYANVESMNDLLLLVRRAEIAPHDLRDRALSALLRRMLALHPADRAQADDVVRELERIRERPARVRRRVFATAAMMIIVGLIVSAFFVSRHLARTERLYANAHGRIAILPFRNETGDASLRWIESGLAELVVEGARRARGADVVPMETVTRAIRLIAPGFSRGSLTTTQRHALLTSLGADALIAPVVTRDNEGKYTIRYAALTPDRAETPRSATSTVLVEAARQMSVDLVQRIDPASAAAVRARYSLDSVANTLYAMGAQEMRTRGPRVAAHYFTVCLDRDPEFLAAKMQLADCQKAMADNAGAVKLLDETLAQARKRNDREMVARGLITRARWAIDDSDYAVTEQSGREALAIARALGDQDLVGRALGAIGNAMWRTGRLDEARAHYDEGLKIFVALRNPQQQAQFYNNLGVLADSVPDPRAAAENYEKAAAVADRINDRYIAATVLGNLAGVYAQKGDLSRAERTMRRQVALTREIGDTASEVYGLGNLGLYLWAQGKEAEAVQATRDGAALAAKLGNRRVETVLLSNLAVAETKLGNLAAARAHSAAALQKGAGLNDPEVERDVQLGLAYTQIRDGRLSEAARSIQRAETWKVNARCLLMRARLAYAHGEYARAFELIRKSKETEEVWLVQNEQMYRAFEESARTGRPATVKFEGQLAVGG